MNTQIDNIFAGFRADVAAEILKHRSVSESVGAVDAFAGAVGVHRTRAMTKLRDICASDPAHGEAAEAASREIIGLADDVTGRAVRAGRVEFEAV